MKFLKKVLIEEANHELDWIRQDRDVRWISRHVAYLIKLDKKKRWPWSRKKEIERPTLQEYKDNFAKYVEDIFDWSPEELHWKYEAGLKNFITHCKSDMDPEFLYLSSTDIQNYCLDRILRRLA